MLRPDFSPTTGKRRLRWLPLPSPLGRNGFPHPTATPDGYQGAFVASTLINLQNLAFSKNDPWLAPGASATQGNNVDAYADISNPDGFNIADIRPTTTSAGIFDYSYDNAQNPDASTTQRSAAVVTFFPFFSVSGSGSTGKGFAVASS